MTQTNLIAKTKKWGKGKCLIHKAYIGIYGRQMIRSKYSSEGTVSSWSSATSDLPHLYRPEV